jgi:hypothetical protein
LSFYFLIIGIPAPSQHFDPWDLILRRLENESINQNDAQFVRGFFCFDGQKAVMLHNNNQMVSMRALVGKGNPAHIDTTFGNSAFCTFFTFRNSRLHDKETGVSPTWIGPGIIHSKEKDSNCLRTWMWQIKDSNPYLQPIFISDECSVLERRIHEVWPNAIHLLGMEHLLQNFAMRSRKLRVKAEDVLILKKMIFGRPLMDSFAPVLQSSNEVEMDHRMEDVCKYALSKSPEAALLAKYVKVNNTSVFFSL